jgi:hypothetical protein
LYYLALSVIIIIIIIIIVNATRIPPGPGICHG